MVLVSHRYKFIYFKNYKAASSSIEAFFQQFCIDPVQQKLYTFQDNTKESITEYGIVSYRNLIIGNSENKIQLTDDIKIYNEKISKYIQYKTQLHNKAIVCNEIKTTDIVWFNHKIPLYVKEDLGDDMFNKYIKFCVVRNPYDVIVSSYYWYKHHSNSDIKFKEYCIRYCNSLFNSLIKNDMNRIFLEDLPVCNYYIRYENLKNDVEMVLQKLGITEYDIEKIPRHKSNIRPENTPYQLFYDDETKELVYNTYKKMIDYFDYTF
jgi:hypothetical protein